MNGKEMAPERKWDYSDPAVVVSRIQNLLFLEFHELSSGFTAKQRQACEKHVIKVFECGVVEINREFVEKIVRGEYDRKRLFAINAGELDMFLQRFWTGLSFGRTF